MHASFSLSGRPVGEGEPPLVVAELSGNHRGDIGRALALIEAAREAGADAIKLQTYTADTITLDHPGPAFRIASGPWAGRRLYDLYQEAHTPWDWHGRLFEHARSLRLIPFSSPFDPSAVDFLETLDPAAYKIASFELVDLPLIEHVAATGRPLILSTGMASGGEIDEAVGAARRGGADRIMLLHCVSGYPTPVADANLRVLGMLRDRYDLEVGLSDHTLGVATSIAAVALGACLIEKHLTLARGDGGPDAAFSLDPAEFARLVLDVRSAWQAKGRAALTRPASEEASRSLRRSLFAVEDIGAGQPFTPANVRSIRPAAGLAPKYLPRVIGRRARLFIPRGTPLTWEMIGD